MTDHEKEERAPWLKDPRLAALKERIQLGRQHGGKNILTTIEEAEAFLDARKRLDGLYQLVFRAVRQLNELIPPHVGPADRVRALGLKTVVDAMTTALEIAVREEAWNWPKEDTPPSVGEDVVTVAGSVRRSPANDKELTEKDAPPLDLGSIDQMKERPAIAVMNLEAIKKLELYRTEEEAKAAERERLIDQFLEKLDESENAGLNHVTLKMNVLNGVASRLRHLQQRLDLAWKRVRLHTVHSPPWTRTARNEGWEQEVTDCVADWLTELGVTSMGIGVKGVAQGTIELNIQLSDVDLWMIMGGDEVPE